MPPPDMECEKVEEPNIALPFSVYSFIAASIFRS